METKWAHGETTRELTEVQRTSNTNINDAPKKAKWSNWQAETAGWLGMASVILWPLSIIQILAIIFGVMGLKRERERPPFVMSSTIHWVNDVPLAWAGIILGVIFLLVRIFSGESAAGFLSSL